MLQSVFIPIGPGMPQLFLISDGTVAFQLGQGFIVTHEIRTTGVSSLFDLEGFSLLEEGGKEFLDYQYGVPYDYKQLPLLKAWLIQQDLINPFPSKEVTEEETTNG